MSAFFKWCGTKSTDLGVFVAQYPPITFPAERVKFTNVIGRSGALTTLEGLDVYDDVQLSVECFVRDTSRIAEVGAWLKGGGALELGNRPGGHYEARVINQIPFEQVMRGRANRTFAAVFRCKPFWYVDGVAKITRTTSGGMITNPGNVHSLPIITITGNGDIGLMIGQQIVELIGVNGSITLDGPLMEAYNGAAPANDKMLNGDFPILLPGVNAVSWSGTVTKVEIAPNWRYLA
jgi:phage-related protein